MNVFYRETITMSYGRTSFRLDERHTVSKLHYGEISKEEETRYFAHSEDYLSKEIYSPDFNQLVLYAIDGTTMQNVRWIQKVTITQHEVDMKTLKIDDVKNLPLNEYIQFVKDNGLVI